MSKDTVKPAHGGGHKDDLESGYPSDKASEGGGTSDEGTGVVPSSAETSLEKGDYPEPGSGTTGRPTAARALATPSRATAGGVQARGVMGDGRGSNGKFCGTMGDGERGEAPHKGVVGQ